MGINKNNALGMNILANLRLNKINQNQLSTDTDIDKSTISKYINGKATITRDHLDKIAYYFNTTPETLLNSNLSQISGELKDPQNIFKYCSMLFPLTMDYSAYENPHFEKAFNAHKRMFECLAKMDFVGMDENDIDIVLDEYELAMENKDIELVSLANSLSVFFVSMLFMKCFSLISTHHYNELPYQAKKGLTLKEHQEIQTDLAGSESEFHSIIDDPDFLVEMLDSLGKLKNSEYWSDLSDYYICLLFVFGLISNSFSDMQNKEFGINLLSVFATCGNQYADNYITKMITTE